MRHLAAVCLVAAAAVLTASSNASAQQTTGPWMNAGDIVVSADGRNVYAGGRALLAFDRDARSGHLTSIGETPFDANQLVLSPDGRFVYAAGEGVIHILERDLDTGRLLHSRSVTGGVDYGVMFGEIRDLAVSPDGTKLYVVQRRESALIVLERGRATGNLTKGQVLFADDDPLGYNPRIAVAPDDRDVYVAGSRLTHFHAARDGKLTRASVILYPTDGVVMSPDGRRVYTSISDGEWTTYARDADTGELTELSRFNREGRGCSGCWPSAPLVAGTGASVFAARGEAGEVLRFDSTGGRLRLEASLGEIEHIPSIAELALSPDGRNAYVTGGSGIPYAPSYTPGAAGAIAAIDTSGEMTSAQTLVPRIVAGAPRPGVTIGDGAIFVGSRDVSVSVTTPVWRPGAFEISNDGGFANATRMAVEPDGEYEWRLPAGATRERMVKRVYVRFVPNGLPDHEFPVTSILTDDVILDTRAPQLLTAKVRRRQLVLRASDDRSGVKKLQLTTNRKKPGAARKYRSRMTAPRGKKPLYVRVVDGAGNRSAWRRAAR